MKIFVKFAAVAALVMVSSSAYAQFENKAGDISSEVQFNPFGQNNNHFSLDGLKVRYFLTNQDAIRVNLGLTINNTSNKTTTTFNNQFDNEVTTYRITNTETERNTSGTNFSIGLGYERHLFQNGRIDVYAGGELGYTGDFFSGDQTVTTNETRYNLTTIGTYNRINTVKTNSTEKTDYKSTDGAGNNNANGFYAAAFTGVDFYIYKGLYIGTELGLRFNNRSTVNPVTEISHNEVVETAVRYTGTGIPAGLNATTNTVTTNWDQSSESGRQIGKVVTVDNPAITPATPDVDIRNAANATENTGSRTSLRIYIEPALRLGWKF